MSNSGKKLTDDDEVENLLRAAQDDMLLKLSINSHMARASASAAIDPDLDRRFQVLKKPQKPTKIDDPTKRAPNNMEPGDNKVDGVAADDLFARFSSLKGSLPSHSRKENKSDFPSDKSVNQQVAEEEDNEDEVERVIKWAMDAARLDPSPPSESDDDSDEGNGGDHGADGGSKSKRNNQK